MSTKITLMYYSSNSISFTLENVSIHNSIVKMACMCLMYGLANGYIYTAYLNENIM